MSADFKNLVCFNCGMEGHKKFQCKNQPKKNEFSRNFKYCKICKNNSHETEDCRKNRFSNVKKISSDQGNNDGHSFIFKINELYGNYDFFMKNNLLVDTGATAHIVTDEKNFTAYDSNFRPETHIIELADGSRHSGMATKKGDAKFFIYDKDNVPRNITLKDALYVPSYSQNIFSVQSATKNGAEVNFKLNKDKLISKNGTEFNISQNKKLYYLNSLNMIKENNKSLNEWHKILGHCNVRDVLKLEKVVNGMNIKNKSGNDKL